MGSIDDAFELSTVNIYGTGAVYGKTTLENGIRVVTETMPQVRSIAISIVVDVGPKDEVPEQSGLAHFVEHQMFKGTGSRDTLQIARLIDVMGV